jgi:hypothetical protein
VPFCCVSETYSAGGRWLHYSSSWGTPTRYTTNLRHHWLLMLATDERDRHTIPQVRDVGHLALLLHTLLQTRYGLVPHPMAVLGRPRM